MQAMFTATVHTTAPRHGFLARAGLGLRRMIENHAARRATRRELQRLAATSPHLLQDIGITPVEADRPVTRTVAEW